MQNILVGTRKGLFIYKKQAQSWALEKKGFLGALVNIVTSDPRDGLLYAVLTHEQFGTKIHRSTDIGETWEEIATPQYPSELPKDPVLSPEPEEKWYQPKLEKIWSLTPGHPSQPNVLWCGTTFGARRRLVYKTVSSKMLTSWWCVFGRGWRKSRLPVCQRCRPGGCLERIVEPSDGRRSRMGLVFDPSGNGFQMNQIIP